MSIRLYKSYTPGTRHRALSAFTEITKATPEKSLIRKNHRKKGRNNRGVITIRHRGGGHKRRYRLIDFNRSKYGINGTVTSIEYDPNRNARIALVCYTDGEKRYILTTFIAFLNICHCLYFHDCALQLAGLTRTEDSERKLVERIQRVKGKMSFIRMSTPKSAGKTRGTATQAPQIFVSNG